MSDLPEPEAQEHPLPQADAPETVEHSPPPPPPDDEAAATSAEAPSEEFEIGEIELELDEEYEEFREPSADAAEEDAGDELEASESEVSFDDETAEPPRDAATLEEGEGLLDEDDDEEDVLEETPEFLRDTPEDERLWFEQGEPRDFDFDDDDDEL